MNTFHIAQISDTHLFANPSTRMMGINTWETFKAVLSLAKNSLFPIDKIVLSGDLCQDQKTKSYQLLANTMKNYPYPCHWIAGNHDNLNNMQRILNKTPFNKDKIIDTQYWRIILANSNLPGKSKGHLTQNELSWIKKSCHDAIQENIMLCVHHHMVTIHCAWLDPIGIDNGSELLDIITHCKKIKLVIFGHIHQKFFARLVSGGFRTVTGAIGKENHQEYRVITPVSMIGIRGTDYTAVLENQMLYVAVGKGAVVLANDKGEMLIGDGAEHQFGIVTSANEKPRGLNSMPAAIRTCRFERKPL